MSTHRYEDYNDMWMVDQSGRFHSTCGMSHPDWAHENRRLVGFSPTRNLDGEPATGDDAYLDDEGQIALDRFKDEGWICRWSRRRRGRRRR